MNTNGSATLKLIEQAWAARRSKDFLDAEALLYRAITLSRKENSKHDLIHALTKLGQLKKERGDTKKAQLIYQEAEKICRSADNKLLLAKTILHLGDIYLQNHQFELSKTNYNEALAILEKEPQSDKLDLANCYRSMALFYLETQQIECSMTYWQKASEIYQKCDIKAGVDECNAYMNQPK